MSVELACYCEELPAHSHVFAPRTQGEADGSIRMMRVDTGEVRIWVDWKAVARAVSKGEDRHCAWDEPHYNHGWMDRFMEHHFCAGVKPHEHH